jgi:hypothetical protein
LVTLFAKVSSSLNNVTDLSLPDIDPVFVVLMGLSQAAYIGGKVVSTLAPQITEIIPKQANAGDSINIFGTDFGGTKGTIWFNDKQWMSMTLLNGVIIK